MKARTHLDLKPKQKKKKREGLENQLRQWIKFGRALKCVVLYCFGTVKGLRED